MDTAGASTHETVKYSTCDVCMGLVQRDSPRGYFSETAPGDRQVYGRYVYVYVHHPNIAALVASAKAGCGACEVFCHILKNKSPSSFEAEKDRRSAQPSSETLDAWSDQDTMTEAAQLAELGKLEGFYSSTDLSPHGPGRIVIINYTTKSGMWWQDCWYSAIFVLGIDLSSALRHSHSPCMSVPLTHA